MLFRSTRQTANPTINEDATTAQFSFSFREYGIYVDRGTGRGVWRGNHGDLGHANRRRRKPWEIKPLVRSIYNMREFFAQSLGTEFVRFTTQAFSQQICINPWAVQNAFNRHAANIELPGTNLPY